MLILRLTQTTRSKDKHCVEISFEGDGQPRHIATTCFHFRLTAQDREDLRWYFEDFLQYPYDPAPKIAERFEKRITEIGIQLFKALFQSSDDARDMWATLRNHLNETRVEVITDVRGATLIPWELIRDPKTDIPLALRSQAFVRAHPQPRQVPQIQQIIDGPVRILLVICRPEGSKDVPFRSVASRLIRGLSEELRTYFQLNVLRPATFEQLGRVLRDAKIKGKPYHVVHFDGHGVYINIEKLFKNWRGKNNEEAMKLFIKHLKIQPDLYSPEVIYPRPLQHASHGYLVFENPSSQHNLRLVDGEELGKLLVETGTSVLLLNACRSAHADAQTPPEAIKYGRDNIHEQVRALGSFAQEVMDAGVAGIVAMRYNVYVVTAAQFIADLYAILIQGSTLGEAVTLGRKQLADKPLREIGYELRPLQDWSVPIVYEAAPISFFPILPRKKTLSIKLNEGKIRCSQSGLDFSLPKSPDVGFFGRDETLLALDRAFDIQSVVLLHAYAGSGKTATAAEFARWYKLTGGVQGPVLFTSFERYLPLERVLDKIGQIFGFELEKAGIHWLSLDDISRRDIALQVLKQIPVLWIWDNVEPVAGIPSGTKSDWSNDEKKELADFLRDACDTKAKFLLTSRRDERDWLYDLPMRITMLPMPMQERVQLVKMLAQKYNHQFSNVKDWKSLLDFSQGNPLTITVLAGQALHQGIKTREQIEGFVARLRAGEAAFEDEASEGRSKSLGASLSYGFENAFTEEERKHVALLHFFQGFVDVKVLIIMRIQGLEWCLPEVWGLTQKAFIALLDRAAGIGLLTSLGNGCYIIHPALPWFFRSMFNKYYSGGMETNATRAFVESIGGLGSYYVRQYEEGNRDFIANLSAEEANLLQARQLARKYGWWHNVIEVMLGLRELYSQTGRKAEWVRLLKEIIPDFIDPITDGPLPGREDDWTLVTEHRARLAIESRHWQEAKRLLNLKAKWDRKNIADALDLPLEKLDSIQRNNIRNLAISLHELAEIQRELAQPECITGYKETLRLAEHIGDNALAAICAYNIGTAYKDIPNLRDLAKAETWYENCLELYDEHDRLGKLKCLGQLGNVALERFDEDRSAKKSEQELQRHLDTALRLYLQSLEIVPENAVNYLAIVYHQLGTTYHKAGDLDRALYHYRESIRFSEASDNLYDAARTRYNIARALECADRFEEALIYAEAAFRNFEVFGSGAADMTHATQELIKLINQHSSKKGDRT